MKPIEFDHWKFTKELWDHHHQHLNLTNIETLALLKEQGFFIALPANDPDTLEAIKLGQVESLLFSSKQAHWLLRQLQPESFEELLIVASFLRSSCFYTHYSAFQILLERKMGTRSFPSD